MILQKTSPLPFFCLLGIVLVTQVKASAEDVQVCATDNDCTDNPYQSCHIQDGLMTGVCSHKGIFPMTSIEGWGLIVFTLLMALSSIGGTGGGAIAVPILMAFFHFNTKPAIAISSVPIFMATAVRFILDYR